MPPKKGKAILRVALDEDLIRQLKIAAIDAHSYPAALVDAALRMYLGDAANLKMVK